MILESSLPNDNMSLRGFTAGFIPTSIGQIFLKAGSPLEPDDTGKLPNQPVKDVNGFTSLIGFDLKDPRRNSLPEGPTILKIEVINSEPLLDIDNWETIEECGVLLPKKIELTDGRLAVIAEASQAIEQATMPGWYMLRISAKNIATQTDDKPATVRLQLWPIDHPTGLRRIKHYPAVVPRAVGLTAVDMESEWNRLMSARSTAGDLLPQGPNDFLAARRADTATIRARAAQHELPPLTGEIEVWFGIMANHPPRRWDSVIPGYDSLTLDEAIDTRRLMLDVWEPGDYPDEAGTPAYTFIPEYVPIAERDGCALVVDLREGKKRGQIVEFDKEGADDGTKRRRSLTRLLYEIAVAIQYRRPYNGYRPDFTHDRLDWIPID
ncbi:MAG: hypothetical protein WAV90_05565 [Gordonia amarae]